LDVYTAPVSVGSPQQVTITATSSADPTKSASAVVTINPLPRPALTSISPSSGNPGTTLTVTLTGTNFVSGATVDPGNSSISVTNVIVVSATRITATFTIAAGGQGFSTVSVFTPSGQSYGGSGTYFTVNSSNPPLISRLTPASGHRGDTWLEVFIFGDRFTPELTVALSNPAITIEYVDVYSTMRAYVGLTIASNATLGPTNLTVTTVSGTSVPAVFTVLQ
jgi:hypothetical protein